MAQQVQHYVKGVEYFSLTTCLKHFRQTVEKETGKSIEELDFNAALFLDDVAKFIGLAPDKRRELLGNAAASFVDSVKDGKVKPC